MLSEAILAEYLRDFGFGVIAIGWAVPEADAAVAYVRKAAERGDRVGDALKEVWKLKTTGRLLANEEE